ncbi:DUF1648 domain-containing protein [Zhihengliuella salsuginis]|uniref:DUF1648 domain-containing protein n=1 Tax=Zhihengliuella salsuginis TaxID=578222 RepID=A0ABQ3GL01_9MICC|nr:DUF1648 domain-containing protein [Zhihengliuella salsuginis]GHD13505.1 hypothetical protein GCM10008096_29790 [Zhihengliuella salsuginis]
MKPGSPGEPFGPTPPWSLALALLPLALLLVTMAGAYPFLPDPLPVHWDAAGEADRLVDKSPWPLLGYAATAAGPVAVVIGIGLLNPARARINGVRDPQGLGKEESERYLAMKGRFIRHVSHRIAFWVGLLVAAAPVGFLLGAGTWWALACIVLIVPVLVTAFRATGRMNTWIRAEFEPAARSAGGPSSR